MAVSCNVARQVYLQKILQPLQKVAPRLPFYTMRKPIPKPHAISEPAMHCPEQVLNCDLVTRRQRTSTAVHSFKI